MTFSMTRSQMTAKPNDLFNDAKPNDSEANDLFNDAKPNDGAA
jgi:hypothetical protein